MDRGELRRRIASRPNAVRFAELEKLLVAYGWRFARAGKGSHSIYARDGERLSLPFRQPFMLPIYVKQVLELTEGEDNE